MAKATSQPSSGVTFVLELTEAEAQYVEAALYKTDPMRLEDDTPWNALDLAMQEAKVPRDRGAAS